MAAKGRIDLRLGTQVLLVQLVIVTLALIVAFALFAAYNRHRLNVQYGVHALDIARVVASAPTVLNNLHPTFWWGLLLFLFGLFYTLKYRPHPGDKNVP